MAVQSKSYFMDKYLTCNNDVDNNQYGPHIIETLVRNLGGSEEKLLKYPCSYIFKIYIQIN